MTTTAETIKRAVREAYGTIATTAETNACCSSDCCGGTKASRVSTDLGYSEDECASVPEGADLGLGCGNPQAMAALRPGERVLDLGSGAGFDALLAARRVGPTGQVIGVDMTPAMIAKARSNATKTDVEFRLGEIEHLPVADESIDVVMSNCVINLSPDKPAVFREAYRVLAPGGRLAIADIVALEPLPDSVKGDLAAHTGCVAGAAEIPGIKAMLHDAGFRAVTVDVPSRAPGALVASALITATKLR